MYMTGSIDYLSVTETLTFSSGSQRICVSVSIVDDGIVEYEEAFSVSIGLSTADDSVTISNDTAEVTILNDDSEIYSCDSVKQLHDLYFCSCDSCFSE